MVKISASLLSARDNLEKTIEEINNLDIDYIHLDIMDGKFVPNTSFTHEEIKMFRKSAKSNNKFAKWPKTEFSSKKMKALFFLKNFSRNATFSKSYGRLWEISYRL